jgi:hypothetical protein
MGAVLAAAFKNIKNRGNELKDLLQIQGIIEIAPSKRTHFCAEKAAIGAERSGISGIVTACRPLAGAVVHDPGSGRPYPYPFSKQSLMPVVIDGLRAE